MEIFALKIRQSLNIFFVLFISMQSALWGLYDFPVGTAIRDQEVEDIITDITSPIYQAAGINPKKVKTYIIIDPVLNAATGMGPILLLNTGFIFQADAIEFAGVIAHETGHMKGRHVEMGQMVIRDKQKLALASMLLGAGTMLANPGAGLAMVMSGPEIARRSFLQYSRGKEASADQSAIQILRQLNWPIHGLYGFLKKIHKREALTSDKLDPYVLTHPITSERIQMIETQDKESKSQGGFPEDLTKRYRYAQAKLKAFCQMPAVTQREFREKRSTDSVAQYAWVISLHKMHRNSEALGALETLIQKEPKNPYFHELKGQILFLMGKRKEALPCYETALKLKPQASLIRLGMVTALLESGKPSAANMALKELEKLSLTEKENGEYWRLLSISFGRQKMMGQMAWALAEQAYLIGNKKIASQQVERALKFLKPGQKGYQEVVDLKNAISNDKENE